MPKIHPVDVFAQFPREDQQRYIAALLGVQADHPDSLPIIERLLDLRHAKGEAALLEEIKRMRQPPPGVVEGQFGMLRPAKETIMSKTPLLESCANCRFFLPTDNFPDRGACRRYPPQVTMRVETDSDGKIVSKPHSDFPGMMGVGWCGTWELGGDRQ